MGFAEEMEPALRQRYAGRDVERVIAAWNRGMAGDTTQHDWADKGRQVAASYIRGLQAEPWHDARQFHWVARLEGEARGIREEVERVRDEQAVTGTTWERAVGDAADAYGPGWHRLLLQDREVKASAFDNFPRTKQAIQDCGVPSVDVLFARQREKTGVKAHTDNCNFLLTVHLALEVPEGDCWMRVGEEKRLWTQGKASIFDPSFVHETRNNGASDRTVLLIRFWHPDLTPVEISALSFIFRAMDDPSVLHTIDSRDSPAHSTFEPEGPTAEDSMGNDGRPMEGATKQFLTGEDEVAGLDSLLADLKAEGLLPSVRTPDQLLAQGPKNRDQRRKAAKASKRSLRPRRRTNR